ncbi:MAG: hypothetical protein QHH06_07990 [Clostridiales bacterium]|jgi:hypothetical protein|nr:hypothetical protein [Eubacteriales bacterium]MDH7566406.1 hypothetical protein [Clostridiales bacterium]
MRSKRSPWILCLLLLSGALIGGIAGEYLSRLPYMGWMGFGGVNGYRDLFAFTLDPLIDVRVLRLGLNFALRVNAGSLIGIILGIILFIKS